jgi:cathepsin X
MRKAAWPDIILSPQVLISCDTVNRGCQGGNPPLAYKWIH